LNAEIKKLAALPIGVYESARVAAAKRLAMRAGVLDKLVQVVRDEASKEQKDFLPHWKVEPWADQVDGAALLDALRNHFNRYLVLPKHADVVLSMDAAHWGIRLLRYHALSGHHVADAAVRQDAAHDNVILVVLSRQEKRQHEQGIYLSER
jgi:hypothetical protein